MSGKQENLKDISNSLNSSRQISKHVYIQVCISPLSYVVICLRSVWGTLGCLVLISDTFPIGNGVFHRHKLTILLIEEVATVSAETIQITRVLNIFDIPDWGSFLSVISTNRNAIILRPTETGTV